MSFTIKNQVFIIYARKHFNVYNEIQTFTQPIPYLNLHVVPPCPKLQEKVQFFPVFKIHFHLPLPAPSRGLPPAPQMGLAVRAPGS